MFCITALFTSVPTVNDVTLGLCMQMQFTVRPSVVLKEATGQGSTLCRQLTAHVHVTSASQFASSASPPAAPAAVKMSLLLMASVISG